MPRDLSPEAKAEWRRVVPEIEAMGLLATVDRAILIRYCTAWADWVELEGLLSTLGQGREGSAGPPGPEPDLVHEAGRRADAGRDGQAVGTDAGLTPARRHHPRGAREARGRAPGPHSPRRVQSEVSGMTRTSVAQAITMVEVPIDQLRPDPANPRRISNAELEALTRSLQQFGFVQPVLARREDKTVIGGHQRLIAARRLGYKTVPVIFLDISLEQARLLNLGLNKISGEWDEELLARLLADLKPIEDIDLALSGFTEDELDEAPQVAGRQARSATSAEVVRPRRRAGGRTCRPTRPTWRPLGAGRPPPAVRRLHRPCARQPAPGRQARPAMAFTDPPYNVALGDHGGQQRGQRRRRIQNDALLAGSSGRTSAAAGRATCSPTSTARSTSA